MSTMDYGNHIPEEEVKNKRHRWADVIIAWANGETIQYRNPVGVLKEWRDINSLDGIYLNHLEWRIKPKKKTGWINIYSNNYDPDGPHEDKEFANQYSEGYPRIACIQITYEEGEGL